jgi:hypothetical protein
MVFVNHERIHLRQQLELLVLLFFSYSIPLEYFVRLIQYRNRLWPIGNISLREKPMIKNRTWPFHLEVFSFMKYITHTNR